jgi:superfamily II DNA/RNA helicase
VEADTGLMAPPEIQHVVYEVASTGKIDALMALLDRRCDGAVLVFGRTKHGVKKLAKQFVQKGYPVGALQGNLSQNARERVVSAFRSGELPILFATHVAARGLDIEGIGQVINYELPESAELFTHRVGRTGRMGREGEAITIVTSEDAPKLRQIERVLGRRLPRADFPVHWAPAAALPVVPAAPTDGVLLRPQAQQPRPAANPAQRRRTRGGPGVGLAQFPSRTTPLDREDALSNEGRGGRGGREVPTEHHHRPPSQAGLRLPQPPAQHNGVAARSPRD